MSEIKPLKYYKISMSHSMRVKDICRSNSSYENIFVLFFPLFICMIARNQDIRN